MRDRQFRTKRHAIYVYLSLLLGFYGRGNNSNKNDTSCMGVNCPIMIDNDVYEMLYDIFIWKQWMMYTYIY